MQLKRMVDDMMKNWKVIAVCATLAGAPFADSVAEQVWHVWREADGFARMTFAFRSPVVTNFEVSVNGRWAGSVAVPPSLSTNGIAVPFDAEFRKGQNSVRIYGGHLPEIVGFSVETPRPSPGLETAKWQAAIDAAAAAGGGRVTIPAGRHLVGGLELKSNVELHLADGAVLEGAVGLENYRIRSLPCSEGTWSAIVSAVGVTNVAITGRPAFSYHVQRRMRCVGKSPFIAVRPSSTMHFGRIAAICRLRYGRHASISCGLGVRLFGGRHLQMFAMKICSRV